MVSRTRRRTPRLPLLAALVLVATAFGLASCSHHDQLDTSKAQQQIGTKLAAYYQPAPVSGTHCPDRVPLAKGSTFQCSTVVQGQKVGIVVTQLDDSGRVSFKPAAAVIVVDKTVQDLRTRLATLYAHDGSSGAVTVDCGTSPVRVFAPKGSFTCAVTAGTQRFRERVTVEDVAGHVAYRPVS